MRRTISRTIRLIAGASRDDARPSQSRRSPRWSSFASWRSSETREQAPYSQSARSCRTHHLHSERRLRYGLHPDTFTSPYNQIRCSREGPRDKRSAMQRAKLHKPWLQWHGATTSSTSILHTQPFPQRQINGHATDFLRQRSVPSQWLPHDSAAK